MYDSKLRGSRRRCRRYGHLFSSRLAPLVRWLWFGVAAVGCSRTGLPLYGESSDEPIPVSSSTPGDDTIRFIDASADVDAAIIVRTDASAAPEPRTSDASSSQPPTGCVPRDESCNGRDDDCDGLVDELPPVPCPGGGSRYCVAGRLSACPMRCEACMPGSEAVCFLSYCTYWGAQTCTADGRGFSGCREAQVPRECEYAIKGNKKTKELEQCCLDNGYCCTDDFDLDRDGIRNELIGRCDELRCR